MAHSLDTLEIVERLEGAGMDHAQAAAIAGVLRSDTSDLVTRDALDAALANAKYQLMLSQVAIAGALFAAIKLFA